MKTFCFFLAMALLMPVQHSFAQLNKLEKDFLFGHYSQAPYNYTNQQIQTMIDSNTTSRGLRACVEENIKVSELKSIMDKNPEPAELFKSLSMDKYLDVRDEVFVGFQESQYAYTPENAHYENTKAAVEERMRDYLRGTVYCEQLIMKLIIDANAGEIPTEGLH